MCTCRASASPPSAQERASTPGEGGDRPRGEGCPQLLTRGCSLLTEWGFLPWRGLGPLLCHPSAAPIPSAPLPIPSAPPPFPQLPVPSAPRPFSSTHPLIPSAHHPLSPPPVPTAPCPFPQLPLSPQLPPWPSSSLFPQLPHGPSAPRPFSSPRPRLTPGPSPAS